MIYQPGPQQAGFKFIYMKKEEEIRRLLKAGGRNTFLIKSLLKGAGISLSSFFSKSTPQELSNALEDKGLRDEAKKAARYFPTNAFRQKDIEDIWEDD